VIKGLDLTGVKQQLILAAFFIAGYIAGELDGPWFFIVLVGSIGAFIYRRRQIKAREQAAQIA
jgi:hypothetical protein